MSEETSALLQDTTFSQLVEKACRHWELRRQAVQQREVSPRTAAAFTIALSRQAGTQGTLVAHEVGNLLGWHVYDHELLELIAQQMGLRTALLESIDERQQSWLRESIAADLASLATGRKSP
jgi:hypothetical protein